MAFLEVRDIVVTFGGLKALDEVSLEINRGDIFALIGPNGAGKSTLFNCINGFHNPTKGDIVFEGREVTRMPSHRISRLGIARTFQNVELFEGMTAMDNILAGRHCWIKSGVMANALWGKGHKEELKAREEALMILDFLGIQNVEEKNVANLPFGTRRLIEIGRGLASKPKLLLLDEPAAGMNDRETAEVAKIIVDIKTDLGISVLLVEHDMNLVMSISDRVCVLNCGTKVTEGKPREVRDHPEVLEAYLGSSQE